MRRTPLLTAIAAVLLMALAPAAHAETGSIVVLLDRHHGAARAHAAAAHTVVAQAGAEVAGPQAPEIGMVTVRPRAGQTLAETARRLRAQPGVAGAALPHRFKLRSLPNDPALSTLETARGTTPGTVQQWWALRENLPAAWDVPGAAGARVAIIDTGVDGSHPELAPRITDAVDLDATPDGGPATVDESGHGTHVASLACATAGNAIGIAGTALNCGLMIFKTDLTDASVSAAIVEAVNRGAQAINMSFGTDGTTGAAPSVRRAIQYAVEHNVVLVAAAADEAIEQQGDPANVLQPTGTGPKLDAGVGLSVTAADSTDQRAVFAGRGSQISLAAYGSYATADGPAGLLGAFPATMASLERNEPGEGGQRPCHCRTTLRGDSRYAYIQGTSMAAPIVTGVAAMVRNVNPDLKARDVVRLLKQTARRPTGEWSPELGWGIVDAGAALTAARTIDRRAPTSRLRAPRTTRARSVVLRWTGNDPSVGGLPASGIDRYEVYRARAGAVAERIAVTSATKLRVAVRRGQSYTFFTVAVDRAGNHEPRPATPDARLRVARRGSR